MDSEPPQPRVDRSDRDPTIALGPRELTWSTDLHLNVTSMDAVDGAAIGMSHSSGHAATVPAPSPWYSATAAHERALGGGDAEYFFAHDGRWYHARVQPERDAAGTIIGTRGAAVDVTDLSRTQDDANAALLQEQEAVDLLVSLNATKDATLSSIGHDLRTPLATIALIVETLQQHSASLTPRVIATLHQRIANNVQRMLRFLSVGVDPEDAGHARPPTRVRADVGSLVRTAAEGTFVGGRRVHLDIATAEADVDPAAIERIVQNLIANALKHTKAASPIWVRVTPHESGALIAVEDEGVGVPDDLKDVIFAPGFHAGRGGGSGMGLSVVARFAELMGGRAWVEDRAGGGASFRVSIPAPHDG